jgi:hypothetical protein
VSKNASIEIVNFVIPKVDVLTFRQDKLGIYVKDVNIMLLNDFLFKEMHTILKLSRYLEVGSLLPELQIS